MQRRSASDVELCFNRCIKVNTFFTSTETTRLVRDGNGCLLTIINIYVNDLQHACQNFWVGPRINLRVFTKTYLHSSLPIVGNASFANNAIQAESA